MLVTLGNALYCSGPLKHHSSSETQRSAREAKSQFESGNTNSVPAVFYTLWMKQNQVVVLSHLLSSKTDNYVSLCACIIVLVVVFFCHDENV